MTTDIKIKIAVIGTGSMGSRHRCRRCLCVGDSRANLICNLIRNTRFEKRVEEREVTGFSSSF